MIISFEVEFKDFDTDKGHELLDEISNLIQDEGVAEELCEVVFDAISHYMPEKKYNFMVRRAF